MLPFTFSWVDLAIVLLVVTGIVRGRKRGMSEELLDIIKWVAVLTAVAFILRPAGEMLAVSTMFSLLSCYVFVYTIIVVLMKLIFGFVRRQIGDKLVSSDFFGSAEYYLGMVAGAFRYLCVIVVAMAFLNARYYSPEEIAADAAFQQNNFGDIRFPTLANLQSQVFTRSALGSVTREFVPFLLIPPTAPETKELTGANNVVRAREKQVQQMFDRR
ncbi:MAG TPA: CvpA family protein [Candidatus Binatia bacterium]|nr:CvpA family protein [Candidatus Binatia bacterium]